MRHGLRLLAAIALAAPLTLGSAAAATSPGPLTPRKPPPRVTTSSDEMNARALLSRGKSLLTGSGVRTGREVSGVLTQLALDLPDLKGTDLTQAERLLARPTDGFTDPGDQGYTVPEAPPLCSPHFCMHYVKTGIDAPDLTDSNGDGAPDSVQANSALLESVWDRMIGGLGWRTPVSDSFADDNGGDGRVDVYLKQLGSLGLYGYAAPDPQLISGNTLYGYLVLDNDFSTAEYGYADPFNPRAVTSAHEFDHLLQMAYDAAQDLWMKEATSTWFEEVMFPAINDYLQYVGPWAAKPDLPITTPSNEKVYGDALWSIWLESRYRASVIEHSWASSLDTTPPDLAPLAYDSGITGLGGQGMSDEFGRFTAATAEWQAPGSGFPDGALYPDVARAGTMSVGAPVQKTELSHGAFELYDVPVTGRRVLTLDAYLPRAVASSIALVARMPDGSVRTSQTTDAGGFAHVTLIDVARATRVTAVLTNADFAVDGFSPSAGDWVFSHDREDYEANVIGRAETPLAFLSSPARQRRSTVIRRGLLVSAHPDDHVKTVMSVQVVISSRYLRKATVVGRAGPIALNPGFAKKSFRVRLSRSARRALARRRLTKLSVHAKFTESTGTAPARDYETVKVVK